VRVQVPLAAPHLKPMLSSLSHINWQPLWQPHNLLLVTPPAQWPLMGGYVGFIGSTILIIIVLLVLGKRGNPNLKRRIRNWAITQLLIGGILFFFRYYRVPYLGMDIFRTIQELLALVWLGFIVVYAYKVLPLEILQEHVEARRKKYLPESKRK
jgi:hypothetical protein